MRRNIRKRPKDNKIVIYSVAGGLIFITLVVAIIMYGNSLNEKNRESQLNSEQIAQIVNEEKNTESASSSIGKTIEEKEAKQKQEEINLTKTNTENKNNTKAKEITTNNISTKNTAKTTETKVQANTKKELKFQKPVDGEIVREFAKENLIYSETLQEWVTHNGVDIKADKATVVQSAEDGTVKSIKNDPRYGLTIVIEHEDGYKTVYANLLSTEFVAEGEKVVKGQSIGTVGNTAAFESAEEPHLHFEILKDSVEVDPGLLLQ